MAKYPSISQTKNGRILIAKSNATGKALVPIKVVTGDGQLTNQNIETMENVINPLLELPFASPGRFVKEGQFQLDFALSNEHLEHGFYAREIGVFAKLNGEDDSMAVMIAYTNGGNFVDYIPAKDTPINSKVFEITIAVDNAANVVVQRSDAAYITAGEMERHNTDANAHGGLLQKVKTKLATHNTDISSHPAITAMIAKILGATNWQENPVATLKDIKNLLGMGGIVAQRLEENGFVKFANGFTIQWGYGNQNYEDLTISKKAYHCKLPISFEHGILFASGQTETNDKVNHYTFVNIAHAPEESTKEKVVFYTWIDWDWSYVKFRLAWMAFGY
mgnify:CR=1 FL=1